MLVIETVNAATFEGIVILLGRQGFTLVVRQVSSTVQRQQPSPTAWSCTLCICTCELTMLAMTGAHVSAATVVLCLWLQEWNSWFVRSGFRPSAEPGSGRDDTKTA